MADSGSSAPWWPSLDASLASNWARLDVRTSLLAASLHFIVLLRAATLFERCAATCKGLACGC